MHAPEESRRRIPKSPDALLTTLTSLTRRFIRQQQVPTSAPLPAREIPPEADPEDLALMVERRAQSESHTVVDRNRHLAQRIRETLKETGEVAWREGDLDLQTRAEDTVETYLNKSSEIFRSARIAMNGPEKLYLTAQAFTESISQNALETAPEIARKLPVLQKIEALLNTSDLPERVRVQDFEVLVEVKDLIDALQAFFITNRPHGGFWNAVNADPVISSAYSFLTDLAKRIPDKAEIERKKMADEAAREKKEAEEETANDEEHESDVSSMLQSTSDSPFVRVYSGEDAQKKKKIEPKGFIISPRRPGKPTATPVTAYIKPEAVQFYYMAVQLFILIKHWQLMARDMLTAASDSGDDAPPAEAGPSENLAAILAFAAEDGEGAESLKAESVGPVDLDGLPALRQKETLLEKAASEDGVRLSPDHASDDQAVIVELLQKGLLYRSGITSDPYPLFILRTSEEGLAQLSWIRNRLSYIDQKVL